MNSHPVMSAWADITCYAIPVASAPPPPYLSTEQTGPRAVAWTIDLLPEPMLHP